MSKIKAENKEHLHFLLDGKKTQPLASLSVFRFFDEKLNANVLINWKLKGEQIFFVGNKQKKIVNSKFFVPINLCFKKSHP